MKKYSDKDAIINHLIHISGSQDLISNISKNLNLDFDYCISICDEIITDEYIEEVERLGNHDKRVAVGPRGRNFIKNEGGYTKVGLLKKEDDKKENRQSFPKRYWWLIAILTYIFGFFSDIGKEWIKQKYFPETNKEIHTSKDTASAILRTFKH